MQKLEETVNFELKDNNLLVLVLGAQDIHVRLIEEYLDVSVSPRGNTIFISGLREKVETAQDVIQKLYIMAEQGLQVTANDVRATLRMNGDKASEESDDTTLQIKTRKKVVAPRTPNQAKYIKQMLQNDLVFGVGPAGTGKTYLAVALAVAKMLKGEVSRLILSRPAVEAGEKLGFLPGDMKEKVDPYLRPIYDALHDMLTPEELARKIELGEIEVAPLAFMRGRTLSNAFIIIDEAQNTTPTQMKMFLTRLGKNSQMVVTGDMSQIDLPKGTLSGLIEATQILRGVEGVAITEFISEDVVRHPLVGRIVKAYEKETQRRKGLGGSE